MNEELKIIITAAVEDAIKDFKAAQKAIKETGEEAKDASKKTDGLTDSVDDLDKSLEEARAETERLNKASSDAWSSIGGTVKTGATVAAGAIVALGGAMVGLAESTREYRTAQGKLNTAFETAGSSADVAREVYTELNGVLGDSDVAVEAASHLAQLTTNQEDLAEWTDIATGVYATFGDSLPIEGLTEAANETAKVGEVTGSLADALNWAGESEEEFNAKLAECVDESQREKLIRETLTKVYKKASDQYKKTNKDVIASNKASEELNAAMADMGAAVEPAITEFKELGTALLKKVQGPLEDVIDFIVKDVIPGIKEVAKWCKENKSLIIGVVTGLTAAMVAYKVATLAAKAAEEGITIATLARAAAQKALNLAMAATPMGLLLAGVTAVAGGLAAYAISTSEADIATRQMNTTTEQLERTTERTKARIAEMKAEEEKLAEASKTGANELNGLHDSILYVGNSSDEYKIKIQELTEEQYTSMEAAREAADAFQQQKTSMEEGAVSIQTQMDRVTSLAEKLMKLADESGKVKEADQARAEYILGELNSALGTEYEMVDGVITKYDELETSIYDVITAKTASSLLSNAEGSYTYALENEKQALEAVNNSYTDWQNQIAKSNEVIEGHTKTLEEQTKLRDEAARAGNVGLVAYIDKEIAKTQELIDKENEKVKGKELAYELDTKNYAKYKNEIDLYETALLATQQGNYQEAIDMLTSKGVAYNDYGDEVEAATARALDALYYEAIQAGVEAQKIKTNFENGVEGYTQEMVDEADKGAEDAWNAWDEAYDEAYGIGDDMGAGLKDGLEDNRLGLKAKGKSIISSIWNAMRQEADSHSPSRKTMALGGDMGEGLEIGIDKSTGDVVKSAKNMIDKTLIPMKGVIDDITWQNFDGLMTPASLPVESAKPQTLDLIATNLVEQLTLALGANNTPIVLTVDGKVFAETSVSTINQLTKQRGSLPLNII